MRPSGPQRRNCSLATRCLEGTAVARRAFVSDPKDCSCSHSRRARGYSIAARVGCVRMPTAWQRRLLHAEQLTTLPAHACSASAAGRCHHKLFIIMAIEYLFCALDYFFLTSYNSFGPMWDPFLKPSTLSRPRRRPHRPRPRNPRRSRPREASPVRSLGAERMRATAQPRAGGVCASRGHSGPRK